MNPRLDELIAAAGPEVERHLELILIELLRARVLRPVWPDDVVDAAMVLYNEFGKVGTALMVLDLKDHDSVKERMAAECVQSGALCLRFLSHLNDYRRKEQP